jgi:hypothetical protein
MSSGKYSMAPAAFSDILTPMVEKASMFAAAAAAPLVNVLPGRSIVFPPSVYVPELEPDVDGQIREDIAKLFQVPVAMLKIAGSSMPLVQESREKIHHDTGRKLKETTANNVVAPMLHAIYDKHRLVGARATVRRRLGLTILDHLDPPTPGWVHGVVKLHVKMPNVPSFAMMESLWEKGLLKQKAMVNYMVTDYNLRREDLNEEQTEPPQVEFIPEDEGVAAAGPAKKPKKASTGTKDHGAAARQKKGTAKDTRRDKGRGTTKKVTRGES